MTVRYFTSSPGPRGHSAGLEIDDESTAVAWQTDGDRVGRFRRPLTAAERRALARALDAAGRAGSAPPARGPRRPGAGTERIIADGVDLTVGSDVPPGAADLVDRLRELADRLTDSPVAAVVLEVTGPPWEARLRHLGAEPLPVRTSALTLGVAAFDRDSALLDTVERTVDAAGVGDRIVPGWALTLVEDLDGPPVPAGGFATVTVTGADVDVRGDGVLRSAEWGWVSE